MLSVHGQRPPYGTKDNNSFDHSGTYRILELAGETIRGDRRQRDETPKLVSPKDKLAAIELLWSMWFHEMVLGDHSMLDLGGDSTFSTLRQASEDYLASSPRCDVVYYRWLENLDFSERSKANNPESVLSFAESDELLKEMIEAIRKDESELLKRYTASGDKTSLNNEPRRLLRRLLVKFGCHKVAAALEPTCAEELKVLRDDEQGRSRASVHERAKEKLSMYVDQLEASAAAQVGAHERELKPVKGAVLNRRRPWHTSVLNSLLSKLRSGKRQRAHISDSDESMMITIKDEVSAKHVGCRLA